MGGAQLVSSPKNPAIKQAIKLQKRRERDRAALFLIEGYRELLRALGKVSVETLLFCPELFLGSNEPSLLEQWKEKGAKLVQTSPDLFARISYRDRPDGLIAIAHQMDTSLARLPKRKNPLYVVAEGLEKPGNLGTILRSADAAGASAVLVADPRTDPHNPNVVRASVGTLFTVPIATCTSQECLEWLRNQKIPLVAATPHAKESYTEANLKTPLAIAVGTEQLGLSHFWLENADIQVSIPMRGEADSLNAAIACALLLYEAVRQATPHSLHRAEGPG